MIKSLWRSSFLIILICAGIFAIGHFIILNQMNETSFISRQWWMIHAFMATITVCGIFLMSRGYEKTKDVKSIGKTYLAYTTVKILLSLAFLSPWLMEEKQMARIFVGHFFSIFFPYLLVETILLIRYLNNPLGEKTENDENQA